MKINYLCEFVTIANLGSFTLAAEELYISQSTLSKHIMALEKELGVQLFDRSIRDIVITETGQLILPYAKQLCELNSAMLKEIADKNGQERVVSIISIPVMTQYKITGAIAKFQQDNPDIALTVREHESFDIPRLLERGDCDFAFIRKPKEENPALDYISFFKDYLVVVLPKSHPLSQEKQIDLLQLRDEEFMFLDKRTMLYELCYNLCISAGFTPKVSYTGHRPENIIDFVSRGRGISFLMRGHTDCPYNDKIACIAIEPTVESMICLSRMKNRKMSSASQKFWNHISQYQV
ncbi:MAG: LysR family transcriptional regulator [Chloroflexota bacterium]